MKIEEIQKQPENGNVEFKGNCHDCGINVTISIIKDKKTESITIEGGAMYNPEFGIPLNKHTFFKCDKCFQRDKTLRDFVPCEVYSRVVGYLRPIQQWNKGKIEEFKQRKEFAVEKELGGDKI